MKPCPFCGGETESVAGYDCHWWEVGCTVCHVEIMVMCSAELREDGVGISLDDARCEAEARWNRRTS